MHHLRIQLPFSHQNFTSPSHYRQACYSQKILNHFGAYVGYTLRMKMEKEILVFHVHIRADSSGVTYSERLNHASRLSGYCQPAKLVQVRTSFLTMTIIIKTRTSTHPILTLRMIFLQSLHLLKLFKRF